MYLFKKEHVNTEKYASLVIKNKKGSIADLNTYSEEYFMSKSNPGIIFTYGINDSYDISRIFYSITYRVSNNLLNCFNDNDLRKALFLNDETWAWKSRKFNGCKCNTYGKAYRVYEAYLNRAEANAQLDKVELALNDLRFLYSFRHNNDKNITANTKNQVLDSIRKDRRLEFCFEDFRWFDLRRYGMPKLEHRYITPEGDLNFVLEEKSKAYTLPIPKKIRELNLIIERISRPQQTNNN